MYKINIGQITKPPQIFNAEKAQWLIITPHKSISEAFRNYPEIGICYFENYLGVNRLKIHPKKTKIQEVKK